MFKAALLLAAFFIGSIVYEVSWKVETVDVSFSADAGYSVVLQSVGEPGFPFGPAPGRLVLKQNGRTVSTKKFEISNDGAPFGKGSWKVTWYTDRVEVVLSGSEQLDGQFTLFFTGETEAVRLDTRFGRELPRPAPKPEEPPAEELYTPSPEEQRVMDGYQAVYAALSGELPEHAVLEPGAKVGASRCILWEDDSGTDCLVYDRPSKNGACGLYARYRCRAGAGFGEAEMVDIYAWVYGSGVVIPSGKTAWSDAGSAEYRRITGE